MDKIPNASTWVISLGFDALVIRTKTAALVTDIDTGVTHMVTIGDLSETDQSPADVIANRVANDAITDIIIEEMLKDPELWDDAEDSCPFCGA